MGAPWLPPGKVEPPAPPPGWLRRAFADTGPERPLVTALVAGPGYGKTMGLLALAQAASAAGARVVWYALDEDDADPTTCFRQLVAAVRRHVPPFGEELEAALAAGTAPPRLLWARFFEGLAAYDVGPLLLVLDDLQRLGEAGEALAKGLGAQLEKLPGGVRLAIASRRKLPFPLAKLQARGQALSLGPERLRFDAAEEAAFLQALGAEERGPQAAALEGWPLGLALLASLAPGHELDAERPVEALSAYLAEEVVAALPADRQAFLRRAAILETATPDLASAVFGVDPDVARQHLQALEADHLAQRLAGAGGWRLPAFLRAHLLAELADGADRAAIAGWHRAAARALRAADETERALPHLIAAGDGAEAAAGCHEAFAAMAARGRQALVARWLDAFPAAVLDDQPILAYWRGWILGRAGRTDEATAFVERARQAFAARGDAAWELKASVKLASFALFGRDEARFDALVARSLALLPAGRPEDAADLHLIRALAAEQRGDLAGMRTANQAVGELPADGNVEVAACAAIAQLNLCTAALVRGDLDAAGRHATLAQRLAEDGAFPGLGLLAGFLLMDLQVVRGEVDAAGAFMRALPARWEDALDWHDRACGWLAIGRYHQVKGAWAEAEKAFAKARAVFARAGFAEGELVAAERQLWLAVRRGQPARALAINAELPAMDEALRAASPHALACALPTAQARLLSGDPAAALATLAAARPGLERLEARLHLTRADLIAGAAHAALGDAAAAAAVRARAEAAAAAHGYDFLRDEDPALWAPPSPGFRHPLPGGEGATSLSPRERVGAPTALQAAPPSRTRAGEGAAPLQLQAFGEFEVRVGAQRLDAWPRRKAKLVLAALMLSPHGLSTYDLAELLADAPEKGAAAVNMVQVSVFALRRILEPDLGKGGASRYVHLRDERYVLEPTLLAETDLRAFDQAMNEGRRLRAGDPAAAAEAFGRAVALYRGDLFAEPFFQRWFEAEREAARADVLEALAWLADRDEDAGDDAAAEAWLTRAGVIAPVDEDVQRRAIDFHADRKRPEQVRRLYWDYRKALKARLGFAPDPGFEEAYEAALAAAEGRRLTPTASRKEPRP